MANYNDFLALAEQVEQNAESSSQNADDSLANANSALSSAESAAASAQTAGFVADGLAGTARTIVEDAVFEVTTQAGIFAGQSAASATQSANSAAASETARLAAQNLIINDLSTSDGQLSTLVNLDTSLAAQAVLARISKATRGRLAPDHRAYKAKNGIFRVALTGMSIASFGNALPFIGQCIANQYGSNAAFASVPYVFAGGLGGSFVNAFQGWKKQKYGGPKFTRLRGEAASTSDFTNTFWGDTFNGIFDRETDSEACEVLIDGVSVGFTPDAGAQLYGIKLSVTGLTRGSHLLTIRKPVGSGFAYVEGYEAYDSTQHGVIVHDWTLGGSSFGNMKSLGPAETGMAPTVQPVGDVAVDAHFARTDIDLHIVMQDVNDAGSGTSYVTNNTLTSLARAIQLTRDLVVPLVLVTSMAGHYAVPNDGGNTTYNTQFERIKAAYAAARAVESHVSHVDWDTPTRLADLNKYQQTYYPSVVGLNVAAGTYTSGDFIHPDPTAYRTLHREFFKLLGFEPKPEEQVAAMVMRNIRRIPLRGASVSKFGLSVARRVASFYTIDANTDVFTTRRATGLTSDPVNHGLNVGDRILPAGGISGVGGWGGVAAYVLSVPTPTTFTVSTVGAGGAQFVVTGTVVYQGTDLYLTTTRNFSEPVEGAVLAHNAASFVRPVYRDPAAVSLRPALQASIDAASNVDEWGRWLNMSNFNITIGVPGLIESTNLMVVIRAAGQVGIVTTTPNGTRQINPVDGTDSPYTTATNTAFNFIGHIAGDEPILIAVPFRYDPSVNANGASALVTISAARCYEGYIVPGNLQGRIVLPAA